MVPTELTLPAGPDATTLDAVLRPLLVLAGQAALDLAGQAKPERKADGSPVTVADRAAERILAEGLAQAFPEDGIEGEEGARRSSSSGRVWVIDPIDGTDAFTHGLAYWGPTVARREHGRTTAGALLLPRTGDYWFADTLAGGELAAWHNGLRLAPLPDRPPHRGATLFVPSRLHHVATVSWPGKFRCLGSTAAHLALVASGGGHAALVGPSPAWDTATGTALIQAVGGIVRTLPQGGLVAGRRRAVEHLLAPHTLQVHGNPLTDLH
ncbi:MAG: inositol-phosphate phosphatase [Oligoflexia bacterium]|nr:inositol-phosphate phosphatase [Oligoflexia bacterium]